MERECDKCNKHKETVVYVFDSKARVGSFVCSDCIGSEDEEKETDNLPKE